MTALKLHLRVLEVHRKTLRVVSLRPQLGVRFSTNYFHDTWHILAGVDGADLLGRLLWGLAFQRQPGTLILIDGDHLVSTPFEGDRADPILVIPDDLTHVDDDDLRALKRQLRRPPPPTTIRWHTFGLPAALAAERPRWTWRRRDHDPAWRRERMSRRAGFVCFTAPASVLRDDAVGISGMGRDCYHPIAESTGDGSWHHDGEVQVVDDFMAKVAAARDARHRLHPEARGLLAETDAAWTIAAAADQIRARRVR